MPAETPKPPSAPPADPTAALGLSHFTADARLLDEKAFAERHGAAFLIQDGAVDPERRAFRPQQTVVFRAPDPRQSRPDSTAPARLLLVYPVRTTGRSPFPRIITVGRTKNNDIVLADISISKFHAFFKEEAGQFFLTDGESRNGTFLDGEPAPTAKQGKPLAVKLGAKLKFGGLELRFVDAAELRTLVRHFG